MSSILAAIASNHPQLIPALHDEITTDALLDVLRSVADTPAPSQSASSTRGVAIETLIRRWGLLEKGAHVCRDVAGSGCDILRWGEGGVRMIAHLDEISYLSSGQRHNDAWPLTAYCYHLADGPRPARTVRYTDDERYRVVSTGTLASHDGRLWYRTDDDVALQPGDRVVLTASLQSDPGNGRVTGSLDNAAGVAALLLAAKVLTNLGIPFDLVLTDEEEGPAGSASQTISRGATRVLAHLPPAPLTVVTDIHGLSPEEQAAVDGHRRPWGASLAEFSSAGRGSVTPPPVYRRLHALGEALRTEEILLNANVGGYVPRSDDIAAMLHGAAVCLVGYPGSNRHFDHGLPTANVEDLGHLAKAVVVIAAAVHSRFFEPQNPPR